MKHHDQVLKSRLGRLLVNRGYISEEQLEAALVEQVEQGCMLGEVLVSNGWITEKDLKRVLRHQKNYRFATAAVTMVVAPLQPMIAMAASPVSAIPLNGPRVELSQAQLGSLGGMQALDDEELADVNAQGFFPGMATGISLGQGSDGVTAGFRHEFDEYDDREDDNEEQIAAEITDAVLTVAGLGPISNFIDAEVSIEGLKYNEERSNIELLDDGRIRFYQPTEIERISMENIRVKGDDGGASFGSIYISDIRFGEGSNYTIVPRN